jgi:hypothetical protein
MHTVACRKPVGVETVFQYTAVSFSDAGSVGINIVDLYFAISVGRVGAYGARLIAVVEVDRMAFSELWGSE